MIRPVLPLALLLLTVPAAAAEPTRARTTVPLPTLVSHHDYPAAAVRAGEQGNVQVRLDIGTSGRVHGCTVLRSSRSAILDSTTCRILRARARFKPARDAKGEPTTDHTVQTIAWRLPTAPAGPPPQVPPEIATPTEAWVNCIGPAVTAGVKDRTRSSRAVAEQSFPACRDVEDRMHAAIADGSNGPHDVEKQRTSMRDEIVAMIEAARARKP
jgi:TonB family protein